MRDLIQPAYVGASLKVFAGTANDQTTCIANRLAGKDFPKLVDLDEAQTIALLGAIDFDR